MSTLLLLFVLSAYGLDWKQRISQRSKEMNSAAFTDRRNLEHIGAGYVNPPLVIVNGPINLPSGVQTGNSLVVDDDHCHGDDASCQCQWFGQTVGCFDCDCSAFAYLLGIDRRRNLENALGNSDGGKMINVPSGVQTGGSATGNSLVVDEDHCHGDDASCQCQWFGQTVGCFDCDCSAFAYLLGIDRRRNLENALGNFLDDGGNLMDGGKVINVPSGVQTGGSATGNSLVVDEDHCHGDDASCQCQWFGQTVGCFDCDCSAFAYLLGIDRRNLHETNTLKDESKLLKSSSVLRKL